MPSVRGRLRGRTIAIFMAASTAAATLVGFLSGAALSWVAGPTSTITGAVLGSAVAADLIHRRTGRLRPVRVNGQVPRVWGTLFGPRVVALLSGARLGVGPLTLLPTWLWWAATGLAAATDAGTGAAVGAAFGLMRAATTVGVSLLGERQQLQYRWFSRLPTHDPFRVVVALSSVVAVLALSACGGQRATPGSTTQIVSPTTPVGPTSTNPVGPTITSVPLGDAASPTPPEGSTTVNPEPPSSASGEPSSPRTTAVRPTVTTPPLAPGELAASLLRQVPGFAAVEEPGADTSIDLHEASQRQPDPAAERALLETRGYRGGWTRAFRNDTQDVVLVTAYEFGSPQQADLYLQDGLITVGGYGGELFDVAELPGAHGFRQTSADASGPLVTYGLTFTEGNRWYLLFVLGDPQTATVDIVVDAARLQVAALRP